MPGADSVIAQWGLFGVFVVALASLCVYLENRRAALADRVQQMQTAHAAAAQATEAAHRAELERVRTEAEARLDAQRTAHQAERAALQARLDQEHAARLGDSKEGTRALLVFTERMHEGIAQLSRLADFVSRQRPPPPTP